MLNLSGHALNTNTFPLAKKASSGSHEFQFVLRDEYGDWLYPKGSHNSYIDFTELY